ncbi:MAG: glutathione S-transferase, partial [Steroidobacteraceae bacterium]
RSHRVLWLLEELGVPYEVVRYERNRTTLLAPASLRRIHPLGKSPVITDGGTTIAESGAIIEYLVGEYGNGRLIPAAGTPQRLRYTYWLHYAEGSAMPPLLLKLVFDRVGSGSPFLLRPIVNAILAKVNAAFIRPQLELILNYMDDELRKSMWFAGEEFTAADIQMSFPLEAARQRAGLDRTRPRLWNFLERILRRPAYRAALERGGPTRWPVEQGGG